MTSSSSPPLMASDLGLDPSDPLNLLLHNSSSSDGTTDNSSTASSPPDWSELSMLWNNPSNSTKSQPESQTFDTYGLGMGPGFKHSDMVDLSSSLPFDMDFNPSMSIEPSALHFDTMAPSVMGYTTKAGNQYNFNSGDSYTSYSISNGLLSPQFPFTFQPPSPESITLSPVRDTPADPINQQTTSNAPAATTVGRSATDELAQRVRQAAGVLLAVPMGMQIGGQGISLSVQKSEAAQNQSHQRSSLTPPQSFSSIVSTPTSSAASTPPPSTPPASGSEVLGNYNQNANNGYITTDPNTVLTGSTSTMTIGASGRTKTSHTTIERRYRTNLNARIQCLRMAVPALRVLERKNKGAKENNSNKDSEFKDPEVEDVVDERGFVDGVRVARKCSKANVLGKAVEYIRVLKKRERRLLHEQAGLKSLLSGLIGGPALLKGWEHEWTTKFGGPEKDELTETEIVVRVGGSGSAGTNSHGNIAFGGGGDDGSDGDDDDEDEGDDDVDGSDEDGVRKKKKAKVEESGSGKGTGAVKGQKDVKNKGKTKVERKLVPVGTVKIQPMPQVQPVGGAAISQSGVVPEKRKRGRPRKNPLPVAPSTAPDTAPSVSSTSSPSSSSEDVHMDTDLASTNVAMSGQGQYLMATFALFSFFNSPLTTSFSSSNTQSSDSQVHAHTGRVLTPFPNSEGQTNHHPISLTHAQWGWQETLQAFHLLVSVMVFASIVLPWIPLRIRWVASKLGLGGIMPSFWISSSVTNGNDQSTTDTAVTRVPTLTEAIAPSRRGSQDEEEVLRLALGLGTWSWTKSNQNETRMGEFERKSMEQRAWVRLGELGVLRSSTQLSLLHRVQTYIHMRAHLSWFNASPGDLCTLAMLVHHIPVLGKSKAQSLWNRAREKAALTSRISGGAAKEHEKLVLENVDVTEAVERLRTWAESSTLPGKAEKYMHTPLGVLASMLVKERVKRHLEVMFVNAVIPSTTAPDVSLAPTIVVDDEPWDEEREEQERQKTLDAARSLGGNIARLGDMLQHAYRPQATMNQEGVLEQPDPAISLGVDLEDEIRTLYSALLLYRRIFPSSILSRTPLSEGDATPGVTILLDPPSSPGRKDATLTYHLREVLGSPVFDSNPKTSEDSKSAFKTLRLALEDARDCVVDMIVECERRSLHRVDL